MLCELSDPARCGGQIPHGGKFRHFFQQVLDGLHSPTPELQQEVIRLLIDHIIVCPNREVRPNRSAELPCPHSGAMM
jgi:hypothetical protein